jgi:hypothetical protein
MHEDLFGHFDAADSKAREVLPAGRGGEGVVGGVAALGTVWRIIAPANADAHAAGMRRVAAASSN